jgi:CRISPR-associated endoribonuclease Cas6
MRIHLKIFPTKKLIPFEHQPLLVGTIHKWLGWNKEHGNISLFSFSRLSEAKAKNEGLQLEKGSSFFFSAYSSDLVKKLISGIQNDPEMFYGLTVKELIIQEDPDLSERELFLLGSPVFIKRRNAEKIDHILYNDSHASIYLKETLKTKMKIAGISDDSFEIKFDTSYSKAGTKKVNYNGIENRASWCPVIIKGNPETKLFAWNVGLGNSTGIGFGAII